MRNSFIDTCPTSRNGKFTPVSINRITPREVTYPLAQRQRYNPLKTEGVSTTRILHNVGAISKHLYSPQGCGNERKVLRRVLQSKQQRTHHDRQQGEHP